MRILFVHAGAVGDFIVTLPVLNRLREARPQASLTIVGRPHIARLALDGGLADRVLDIERAWVASLFGDRPQAPAEALPCDLCVTYLKDPALSRSLRRLGASLVLEGTYRPEEAVDVHWADLAMGVLDPIGLAQHPAVPRLVPSARSVEASLATVGEDSMREPIVAMSPGTGSARKRWPLERWIELMDGLVEFPHRLVILEGPGDGELIAEILARLARARPTLAADLPLPIVAGLLTRARAYVGCDSGITHLAAAVSCPTLALFGPTHPERFAPRGAHVRAMSNATAAEAGAWLRDRLALC